MSYTATQIQGQNGLYEIQTTNNGEEIKFNVGVTSEDQLDEVSTLWDEMKQNLGDLQPTLFIKNYITSVNENGIIREKALFKHIKTKKYIENNVEKFASQLKEEANNYKELFQQSITFWNDKDILTSLKAINTLKPIFTLLSESQFSQKHGY